MGMLTSLLVNFVVFGVIAVGGGLASAWYMIEAGSRLSTRTFGPWIVWTAAGRPEADPYTRAHIFRNGLLPLSTTLELAFRARTDSNGARLSSACEYTIVLDDIAPAWWNIAVFDAQGRPIPNPAERHAFNSSSALREPDGRAVITLARDARPGNWLPSGRGSSLVLALTIQDPAMATAVHDGGAPRPLPEIKRGTCR
jgi:hypothetical protein